MKKKRIIKVIILFALCLTIPYLNIPCIFNKITGLYCPGCGITRMFIDILHFNFKDAFYHNMLVFILLPFITALVIYQIYLYINNKIDDKTNKIPNWIMISLLIITLSFGVLRNIEIFKVLAP